MTIITVVAIVFFLGTHAAAFIIGRLLGRRDAALPRAPREYLNAIALNVGLKQRHGESTEQFRQRIKDHMRVPGSGR